MNFSEKCTKIWEPLEEIVENNENIFYAKFLIKWYKKFCDENLKIR